MAFRIPGGSSQHDRPGRMDDARLDVFFQKFNFEGNDGHAWATWLIGIVNAEWEALQNVRGNQFFDRRIRGFIHE